MNNDYLINGYYLVSSVDAFKRSENNPLTGTVYTFDEKELGYRPIGVFSFNSEKELVEAFRLDDVMLCVNELKKGA